MNDWLSGAVFYQIYPNSFKDSNGDGYGDFKGITEKLEYIASLGCNGIWLNPCFDSPFCNGGYDVKDYFNVASRFGTMEDLEELLACAHELNIKVILDLVAGHTSEQNEMFYKSGSPEKNEFTDRYIWNNSVWKNYEEYRLEFGRAQRNGAYMVNLFSMQPSLNYGFNNITHTEWQLSYKSEECIKTRDWLIGVIDFWLCKGFDGFRVDMADSLVKNDDKKSATVEVWQYILQKVKKKYPESIFISEWSDPEKALIAGFDADFYLDQKDNGYYYLCRRVVEGENVSFFNPEGKGDVAAFMYDYLNRFLTTKKLGKIAFITGNHDIYRLAEYFDIHQLKLIYGVLLTLPGIPFIYYGDEIGLACKWDVLPKEGGFHRTLSRTPMQWDNSKNCGFSDADEADLFLPTDKSLDKVNVKEQLNDEDSLLNFIKKVLKLRKNNFDFCTTDFEIVYCESGKFPLIYKRGRFTVVVNPTLFVHSVSENISGREILRVGDGIEKKDKGVFAVLPKTFIVIEN